MISFGKQGTCCDWCANVVWGVWSMAFFENRIFCCFGQIVVDRNWWHYVKTKKFCTCCFREIIVYRIWLDDLFFFFRENVVDRIIFTFFPFCEIFIDRILINVVSTQPLLMEFGGITWKQTRFCACCLGKESSEYVENTPLAEICVLMEHEK